MFGKQNLDLFNFQDSGSIKHLKNTLNPSSTFSQLLRGSDCMGEYLHNHGCPSVPSASDPAPLPNDPFFSGGYNVARHGSRDSSDINGIQFELNYTGVKTNSTLRNAFARAMACALKSYIDKWYFDLDTWDPGNIVTSNLDNGPGSLRSVLLGVSSGDTVTFDPSIFGDTIYLKSELQICTDVTIIGPKSPSITLSGRDSCRIMYVSRRHQVEISNLNFVNGHATSGEDGGAAFVSGNLHLKNCILSNNYAGDDGGAIAIEDSISTVQLDSCVLINNSCNDNGGAIRCWKGTLIINESTLKNNSSPSYGGAISMNGTATITNSTFSNNSADNEGGAIRNFTGGVLTCTNSTFSGNSANYRGGAISASASVDLNFCTVVNNTAISRGGGIRLTTGGSCILRNSLIANNSGSSSSDVYQFSSLFNSLGNNFIGDTTGSLINTGSLDQFGNTANLLNPMILQLAQNVGNTETIALSPGSPCIDAANSSSAPTLDQLGNPRIINGLPDIGAFEFQGFTVINKNYLNSDNLLTVYPNPTKNQLIVEIKTKGDYQLIITNVLGEIMYQGKFDSYRSKKIDVSNYPKGNYFAQIVGDIAAAKKFVVQ